MYCSIVLMAKTNKKAAKGSELDSVYVLKLVMYIIVGSLWVRFKAQNGNFNIPVPIGLLIGLLFAWHEHFQIDRKIEYAILLVAMVVGFWSGIGLSVLW